MKPLLRQYGAPVASGILIALAFPTWHIFFLAWVALAPLFAGAARRTIKESAFHFFLAGLIFHAIVLQWVLANTMVAGGWAVWGLAALATIMALYWAAFGAVWTWVRPRLSVWSRPIAAGALWAAMEQAQGTLFRGFGWTSLGYTQGPDAPVLQLAALGSGLFISLVLVAANAALGEAAAVPQARIRLVGLAGAVVVAAHLGGLPFLKAAEYKADPLQVGIFQSDFPLDMKWDPEYDAEMVRSAVNKSLRLAQQKEVDIFFWPEALVMSDITGHGIQEHLQRFSSISEAWLFTGSTRRERNPQPAEGRPYFAYNSSYLVGPDGELEGHYDKVRLAPFGEYVPLSQYLPFINTVIPAIGSMDAGQELKVFEADDRTFGPMICFEVIFPGMAERLRTMGADYLVVITNLAWFGRTNAIAQELEIARMRAVETRMPLVHSANTGISGVFDPYGRFQTMTDYVDGNGRVRSLPDGFAPTETILMRLLGAFPLAEPAERPVPFGPAAFPWVAVGMSLAVLVLAWVREAPPELEEPPTGE